MRGPHNAFSIVLNGWIIGRRRDIVYKVNCINRADNECSDPSTDRRAYRKTPEYLQPQRLRGIRRCR